MRRRRSIIVFVIGAGILLLLGGAMPSMIERSLPQGAPQAARQQTLQESTDDAKDALTTLELLEVKGRAPKTGYSRDRFGNGWGKTNGCDTRNIILYRDLVNPVLEGECTVVSGILNDPYTGAVIEFHTSTSSAVQIDHVVALSDAWQKGAQQLSVETRKRLANDPLNLLAVDGPANRQKSDGDAATWLPKNKAFRCEYVERQVAVKHKYELWVTGAEKEAIKDVLSKC